MEIQQQKKKKKVVDEGSDQALDEGDHRLKAGKVCRKEMQR